MNARAFRLKPALAVITALLATLAAGCAASSLDLWQGAVVKSGPRGFVPVDFPAGNYHLAGLLKSEGGHELVAYIEGDGRAIVNGRPSSDPTPRTPQALDLALQDPAPNVLYLARIGQYMPAYATEANRPLWSDRRLSPEAVAAASEALDQAKKRTGALFLHLVGYSGGGGLAVLLAERRGDVVSLVTVAGLLDTEWWVATRGYRPLIGSLNPADSLTGILNVPQLHFYGTDDKVIPPEMSRVFASKGAFTRLARLPVQSDHYKAWTAAWRELLEKYVLPLRQGAGAPAGGADL
ncbi:MAG: serine hydrolase family protein [Deltaproteobacteria bacterium]|jgi:pimeloyl-ACP methyl ester carboxylesterase|nr:serine hydrolase family protein [Deltaproteobacteria bacterium]